MNARKLTTGFYRPTESFKSIPEHIAVMFEDNQTLVALVGASDDDPENLAETNEYAELFANAPAQAARIQELEAENMQLKKDALFLANVWVTIQSQGLEYIAIHGDPDGIDFVASKVIRQQVSTS